jgi:hypothetical protein
MFSARDVHHALSMKEDANMLHRLRDGPSSS